MAGKLRRERNRETNGVIIRPLTMTDASAAYTRDTPVTRNPILASFNIHGQKHDPDRHLEHSCDHMVPQDQMSDYDILHSHTQRDELDVSQNERCDRGVLHAHTQRDRDVVQDHRDGHDVLHRHTQSDRDVVQDHRDGHDVLHRHTQSDRDVVQDHRDGHDVLHRHTQRGNNVDVLLNERCDRKVLHSQTGDREVLKGQRHDRNVLPSHARGGHSYGAFHGDALVGVLFAGIQHSDTQTPSEVHPPYTEQKSSITEQKVNIFDHYGVTVALHIYRLAVHPDYTQQGLGFKLIKHTLDKARGMGIQCFYIWTSDDRTSKLFEELGFDNLYEMKDKDLLDDVGKPLSTPLSSNCAYTLYGKYYSDVR